VTSCRRKFSSLNVLLIVIITFIMVQPWNIGVCWIDLVFVTELSVGISFVPIQPSRVYKQHLIWMLMATSTGLAMLNYQHSTYVYYNRHPAIIPCVLYPLKMFTSLDIHLSYPMSSIICPHDLHRITKLY